MAQELTSHSLEKMASIPARWFPRLHLIPIVPIIILSVVMIAALLAPWLAPHDAESGNLVNSFRPPVWEDGGNWSYVLGTDANGRDVLSRLIYGTRIPVLVVLFGVISTAFIGTSVGIAAGYLGGKTDTVLMRLVDTFLAIPPILMAIAIIGVLGSSLQNVIIVVILTSWAGYARVIRSEALRIRGSDHIGLARVAGCGAFRIMRVHILPEVTNTLIVLATLSVATFILYEAALSFLGLGVRPPTPSWGSMISEGRIYMTTAWWLTVVPGVAILITCLSANLLGDWLRDQLDPRLRNVGGQ
jgi:peptide/nickel transport system permease protein